MNEAVKKKKIQKERDYSSTQKLIKKVVLFFIILVGLYIAYSYTSSMLKESKNITAKNARESRKIKKKYTDLNNQLKSFYEAHELYQTLPKLQKPDTLGYATEASRIRLLQPRISELKDKYYLKNLSLKLADFELVEEYKKNPNLKVATGKVQLTFGALTDSFALGFIKDLLNSGLPGFIEITDLQITKIGKINQEYLYKTGDYNVFDPLLEVDIILKWTTIRDFSRAIAKFNETGN